MAVTNAGNGLNIADGSADLEIFDGFGTWGFRFTGLAPLIENRGDAFAGQVASGGQNYDDATPFKRKVYDNFMGGLGQVSDNKVTGGVGIGGDDTKYFYADATTDRMGYLLPGFARNQLINPHTLTYWSSGGSAYNHYQENEIPRGVLPCTLSANYTLNNFLITTVGQPLNGITTIRVLVNLRNAGLLDTYHIYCDVYLAGSLVAEFTGAIIPITQASSFNGWTWLNLSSSAFNFTAPTSGSRQYDLKFYSDEFLTNGPIAALGCYVGDLSNIAGGSPARLEIRPYFQVCKAGTTTPYTWWQTSLRKVHQLFSNGYFNVAVTNNAWFNSDKLTSGGTTPASSPEVVLTGTYTGSIVWNNNLYVVTTSGVTTWPAAGAHDNLTGTLNPLDAGAAGCSSLIPGYGKIFMVGAGGGSVVKWDGNFPVTLTTIVTSGSVGDATTAINKIILFQGNLWAFKPEGAFLLYGDPTILGTTATNTPRILPMGDPFPSAHTNAGAFATIHQGSIYVNYKDRIYQYTVGADNGLQVQVLSLPIPWYRLGSYYQVDGIASDGVNLYVSYNNLGVFKYLNLAWHPVTEIYDNVQTEPTNSGLTWVANPSGGVDNLYFRDQRALVRIPCPSAASPFTRQISLSDQNKCGYLITSFTNMETASLKKYIFEAVLTVMPSDFCFLIRPVIYVPSAAGYLADPVIGPQKLLDASFQDGLIRDSWMKPTIFASGVGTQTGVLVGTQKYSGVEPTSLADDTIAPCYWSGYEFNQGIFTLTKTTYVTDNNDVYPMREALTDPANFVTTAFILYFFNPVLGQFAAANRDLMAIESVEFKYQSLQNYLALYKLSLDCAALTEERGGRSLSQAEAEDSWEWLRAQLGRHSPTLVTIKVRESVDPSPPIAPAGYPNYPVPPNQLTRTFMGFLENPADQYSQPVINQDSNNPLPRRLDLQIIATSGEFPDV